MDWIQAASDLTPWETAPSGVTYKREDKFAPLGYGGPNGSKLRQLVHLIHDAHAAGAAGVLTGCSVLSPQGSMAALVAQHYGLPCTVVYGATRAETAIRHDNVAIAALAGADFEFTPVGFNPALQRAVEKLTADPRYAGRYRLCYGISTPLSATDGDVAAFHAVGAAQLANIPSDVGRLVMTMGSANTCTSVIMGLAQHPNRVRRLDLIGIGPTRWSWMRDRLEAIASATGLRCRLEQLPFTIGHIDLHSTGVYAYADRRPWTADGIDFHPTYEGKAMEYLATQRPELLDGDTGFWIVGSAPNPSVIRAALAAGRA